MTISKEYQNHNVAPTALLNYFTSYLFYHNIAPLVLSIMIIVLSPIRGDIMVEEVKNISLNLIRGDIMVIDICHITNQILMLLFPDSQII